MLERSTNLNLNNELLEAAEQGQTEKVMALLEQGTYVNVRGEFSMTPLHFTAERGHPETAIALIDRGADHKAKDFFGSTPLHCAAVYGRSETAIVLINRGAEVNAIDDDGGTALHDAANFGHSETAIALIDRGAEVNAIDDSGRTPLHYAAERGHTETAIALIDRGAEVNALDDGGRTPLHHAAQFGHSETVAALIYKGADIAAQNKDSKTFAQLMSPEKLQQVRAEYRKLIGPTMAPSLMTLVSGLKNTLPNEMIYSILLLSMPKFFAQHDEIGSKALANNVLCMFDNMQRNRLKPNNDADKNLKLDQLEGNDDERPRKK